MTDQSKDFSPEAVLAAVAKELRYNRDDLDVSWDEKVDPRVVYYVTGKANKMEFLVYLNEAEAERGCQDIIHESLFTGQFFEEPELVDRAVLDAVAKVCNLADLTPFLTMVAREGWAMPDEDEESEPQAVADAQTIPEIKSNQAAMLDRWLKDPVAAVWRIQDSDLASTLAVLIEQCSFDIDALTKAIMVAMGGWKAFAFSSVVATTPEGYVITADNIAAVEYLEELYQATKNELPEVGR